MHNKKYKGIFPIVGVSLLVLGTISLMFIPRLFNNKIKIEKNNSFKPKEETDKSKNAKKINLNDKNISLKKEFINSKIFNDNFEGIKTIEETGKMEDSRDKNWWVNSGAFLYVNKGVGKTIFGKLPKGSKWQKEYKDYNTSETDNGYHPQNIFRLVTKQKWQNFTQECEFKIDKYILSKAKERSASNGILLFNRYQDGNNLYYTGLRVDGAVVVKKKYQGKYYSLGYRKILNGNYNKKKNPNLIPLKKWVRIKSIVRTIDKNRVQIKVLVQLDKEGKLVEYLNVIDDGKSFGGPAILNKGYAGIRTDFMDVEFDNYTIKENN